MRLPRRYRRNFRHRIRFRRPDQMICSCGYRRTIDTRSPRWWFRSEHLMAVGD